MTRSWSHVHESRFVELEMESCQPECACWTRSPGSPDKSEVDSHVTVHARAFQADIDAERNAAPCRILYGSIVRSQHPHLRSAGTQERSALPKAFKGRARRLELTFARQSAQICTSRKLMRRSTSVPFMRWLVRFLDGTGMASSFLPVPPFLARPWQTHLVGSVRFRVLEELVNLLLGRVSSRHFVRGRMRFDESQR